jgi:glycosyltransferase involved in cell wall biosynthesis
VATGSSQEFVLDGKTGFLVPPGRPDLLAERVAQLLSDAELRTAMAEAARARALQLFSPELYREKLLSAFGLSPLAVPPRFPEQPGS